MEKKFEINDILTINYNGETTKAIIVGWEGNDKNIKYGLRLANTLELINVSQDELMNMIQE